MNCRKKANSVRMTEIGPALLKFPAQRYFSFGMKLYRGNNFPCVFEVQDSRG